MGKKIICCKCKGELSKNFPVKEIEDFLTETNTPHYIMEDLCGVAANKKKELQELILPVKETLIIACNSRAINLLLEYAGADVNKRTIQYIKHRNEDLSSIKNKISHYANDMNKHEGTKKIQSDESWPSWYPLIDYERCTDCGQCAEFCLFGVYEKNKDGKVEVVDPHGCKDQCPACARICPSTAIIFPKFAQGGAISGSGNINETMEKNRLGQDLKNITGGDIYKTLEKRKRKRQSIIKKQAMEKAQAEREKALKNTKEQ